jgi:hypothetical protein
MSELSGNNFAVLHRAAFLLLAFFARPASGFAARYNLQSNPQFGQSAVLIGLNLAPVG